MAGVIVLDIADDILMRLGEPTVSALARRFGPDGRCLCCSGRLGAAPLSVRAYRDHRGIITLVAYHAGCAVSAWVDISPGALSGRETCAAAVTAVSLPVTVRRWFRTARGPGARNQLMPVLFAHPSLEMTRVRQVGPGEAVNADIEGYRRLGFADPGALASTCPTRPIGHAWMQARRGGLVLHTKVADRTWSAPIPRPTAVLAGTRGGILIGVTCDRDPGRLAAEPRYLTSAFATGDVLLGWAPLPAGQHQRAEPGRPH